MDQLDMRCQTHLQKRHNTYYFRAKIPCDLQAYYGRKEVKFSLKTKDRLEAVRLVRQKSADLDREFQSFRHKINHGNSATPLMLDDKTIESVCDQWKYLALDGDERTRQEGMSPGEFEEYSSNRSALEPELRQALARGETNQILQTLYSFLLLLGNTVSGDTASQKKLAYRFLQTVTETHHMQVLRDQGSIVKTPAPPPQIRNRPDGSKISLNALFERWQQAAERNPRTVSDIAIAVNDYNRYSKRQPASTIVRSDLIRFRDHLLHDKKLAPKTAEKKISHLRALFQLAVDDEVLAANPATGIRVSRSKNQEKRRRPFDSNDLKRIFQSELYTRRVRPKPGGGEASVWLPALALYTGNRLEELGQLRVKDVKCEDGIWHLHITECRNDASGADTQLKTAASERRLPLHPDIIAAGFLEYVESMNQRNETRLFPSLGDGYHGRITHYWSKWWGYYQKNRIGIRDESKVFHSFRHSFRDACREAEIDEEVADALMGHSRGGTGRRYGSRFSLQRLYKAIYLISYPGFALPRIYP